MPGGIGHQGNAAEATGWGPHMHCSGEDARPGSANAEIAGQQARSDTEGRKAQRSKLRKTACRFLERSACLQHVIQDQAPRDFPERNEDRTTTQKT